jgi:hypothetical protein
MMRKILLAGLGLVAVAGCPSQDSVYDPQGSVRLTNIYSQPISNMGDVHRICGDDFECLQEASELYPGMRNEICEELELEIRQNYGGVLPSEELEDIVAGQRERCEAGFGAMAR